MAKAARRWRVARSIEQMRAQVNAFAPNRSTASDGTIGDAAHAATVSDHNPNAAGVVTAIDLTHSPTRGFDSFAFAEKLRLGRDPRIKYVISNRRIFSATVSPWQWRGYTGSHPHQSHVHISVSASAAHYDDNRPWDFGVGGGGGSNVVRPERPTIRRGDKGIYVYELQTLLGDVRADSDFGPLTDASVRRFQESKRLVVDGVVGPLTWSELDPPTLPGLPDRDSPEVRPVLRRGMRGAAGSQVGDAIRAVQRLLMLQEVDGDFGPLTEAEVLAFQKSQGLEADGVVEAKTWAKLDIIHQLPRPDNFDEAMELSEPLREPAAAEEEKEFAP